MIRWMTILIELAVAAGLFCLSRRLLRQRLKRPMKYIVAVLSACALFVSFSGEELFPAPQRTVTITAMGEGNEKAKEATIYLTGFTLDGEKEDVPEPVEGRWSWYNDRYSWFAQGDDRRTEDTTDQVTFSLDVAWNTQVCFLANQWKGKARVETGGETVTVDTHSDKEKGEQITVDLPHPAVGEAVKAAMAPVFGFTIILALSCVLIGVLATAGNRLLGKDLYRRIEISRFSKLLKYQFLFEELVKRDFKKKYKRTVLGMAWSVLSPLLTLLVMRLVFTQFFGRHTPHYTTYLFCGNLVFSYFNESTSQGMSALRGNAGIFTKVNVPKYLFLFSKNVQTLINFGLTLCVFFTFCVIDQITFTWKFICLLYPIIMLLLFNIGVGLILSALFIFFRDIQYLWSVFIQLLMYMSAIFYTIDGYSPMVRNLFLLNPVYLFIRYFRKIVIEATIPTIWFHLLMAADVAIVLGIGCWMYKKYNHKFLYYV